MNDSEDQVLADDDFNKYYILRARCEVCKTKTWHFVWLKYYQWDVTGMREPLRHNEGISNCIEHSYADDYDRYKATHYELSDDESSLFKTLREGQSFSFELQYDPNSPFIKWARDLILKNE